VGSLRTTRATPLSLPGPCKKHEGGLDIAEPALTTSKRDAAAFP
jgi:hypothetical protein